MRRVTKLVAMAAAATFALAACGGGSDDTSTSDSTAATSDVKVGMAYDVGGRGDLSFNDSAATGLDQAASDFGVEVKELEASDGETDSDREERLRLLADGGYNPIIAVGYAYATALGNVAPDYPDTQFGIVDDSSLTDDNVTSLVFAEEQGSFLVGAIAATASSSGSVGFIGATANPLIQKFEAGFTQGAKAVNADIDVQVKYLGPTTDTTVYNSPDKAETAADGMIDSGADVIYTAAGGSGSGTFKAIAAAGDGYWAIGVDSDQYLTADDSVKDYILTSMLKRVDTAVYDFIESSVNGDVLTGVQTFDLSTDGVGYSTSNSAVEEYTDQIDDLKQQIIDGDIEVSTTP